MARKHRGFTLIELLVVVGIILVLMGIAVIAFAKLDKVAGDRSTRTRLEALSSILNEYEMNAGGLSVIETYVATPPAPPVLNPLFPDPSTTSFASIGAPGYVTAMGGSRYSGLGTYGITVASNGASWGTALVLLQMSQVPSAKNLLAALPGSAMLTSNTGTTPNLPWTCADGVVGGVQVAAPMMLGGTNQVPLPVVLDAWKDPIIFVPAGGMTGVWIGGAIPPAGSPNPLPPNFPGGPWATKHTVVSRDNRPFWASAGQDGSFQQGDDNLYSCPVLYR